MQTTSALYNQILTDINHTFEVKLEIGGVVYGMDSLLSLETNCKVFDNKPTIGGVYSATCQFSFLGNGQNIPRMAQCVPFFRITNGTDTSEWIKKGVFYIDTREVTKNGDGLDVFSAFCYDGMMMANSDYSTSELEWPATDADVVEEICSQIGVLQDPRNASIITEAYSISFPVQYTKRDVLSYIAAMYGANWIMTDEGKLRLIPMTGNADSIDIGKSLMGLNVSPTRPPFTQVVLMVSDTDTVISGNNQSNVIDAYCPFATQAVADRVYSILSTWSYHPFNAGGVWANPALELGDQFTANENTATVFSRDLHFGSGMTMALSAPVEEYIDHEYAFESPADRRYTRTIGDLKSEITLNENKIALVVSETAGGLEVNAASIVASINDSGSSVIISADKVDLEGYVTFSNLKTGGRNLLRGSQYMNGTASAGTGTWNASKFFKSGTGTITWNYPLSNSPVPDCDKGVLLTATSVGTNIGFGQAAYPSLQDGPFTLSFWVKGTAGDSVFGLEYYALNRDRGTISEFFEISQTNVWQRIVINFNNDHPNNIGGVYRIGYIYFQSNTVGNSAIICAPKLEYGNVATSWSPAPEDSPTFNDLATEGQTVIDGGNIKTNTITADKINLTDLFAQNITASNFHITGGSVQIQTNDSDYNYISISGQYSNTRINASNFSVYNIGGTLFSNLNYNDLQFWRGKKIGELMVGRLIGRIMNSPTYSYMNKTSSTMFTSGSYIKLTTIGSFGYVYVDLEIADIPQGSQGLVGQIASTSESDFYPLYELIHSVSWGDKTCTIVFYRNGTMYIGEQIGNWNVGDKIITCFPVFFKLEN